jgi:hypothetical protein
MDGIKEFIDVPGRCQGSGFRFAVPHHSRNNQVGIVESSAAGMREHVAELPSFVDRTRRLRRAVTPDTAWEGELFEELTQTLLVFALICVDFRISPFQIHRSQNARGSVTGSR